MREDINKIETGLPALDNLLDGGFSRPSLVTIAARPSMGKTALCLTLLNNFLANGKKCLYISLAESEKQIDKKLLLINPNVDLKSFSVHNYINLKPLSIDRYFTDVPEILIIDYLQVVNPFIQEPYKDTWNFLTNIKHISLKENILIILVSQLSRKTDERGGHRPSIIDFPDCDYIASHSDQVLFLLRREYYDPNDKPGMAELIVVRNRFGDTGSVNLLFNKEKARFEHHQPMDYSKFIMSQEYEAEFSPAID
jgi:replicative DNA helicase